MTEYNLVCLCDCGKTKEAKRHWLLKGLVKSCGCFRRSFRRTHGRNTDPLYRAWTQMKQRCSNPKNQAYSYYGGRGIKVCERWEKFENFLEDIGERPTLNHTIERIKSDGDYGPENCVWATRLQQQQNIKSNRNIHWRGQTMSLSAWSREMGIGMKTIQARLTQGWPLEKVFSTKDFSNRRSTTIKTTSSK